MGADLDLAKVVACERIEAAAWSDLAAAAPLPLRRTLGIRIEPVGDGMALMLSEVSTVLYNRIFGFGLERPIEEPELEHAILRFRRDHPFTIQPAPMARPPEIRRWLERRGLRSYFNWVRWWRPTGRIDAHTTMTITPVRLEEADAFANLAFRIFDEPVALKPWLRLAVGRPGWTCYIGRDGDLPVATGALFVRDGMAWLGWAGTLPSHRGRGLQSAMIARRIADAAADGCRFATSETAEELPERPSVSFRNMRRAGFTLLYRRPSHASFPDRRD